MAVSPAALAGWCIKNGLREFMSEIVPALIGIGVSDPAKLDAPTLKTIEGKVSKKAFQGLQKKLGLDSADPATDHGPSPKKKKKVSEPIVFPTPNPVSEVDLEVVVFINRAPVLQLWATCCLKLLGYTDIQALAIASGYVRDMSEQKRKMVGLYVEKPPSEKDLEPQDQFNLFGYQVSVPKDQDDLKSMAERALRYLKNAYGDDFERYVNAFFHRANQMGNEAIASELGYMEYERFRPPVSAGSKGFGEKSRFRLNSILG